jgi:hypothetical protein
MISLLKSFGNKLNKDLLFYLKESRSRDHLSGFLPLYFPYSHYSIRYYDLELIVNQILFSKSKYILELGSGLSTLCLGLVGKKIPDLKIHVIEHDKEWIQLMNSLIEMNDIKCVNIEYAPLIDFKEGAFSGRFFDVSDVRFFDYDAVIIDGPPAMKLNLMHSRYPAIHLVKKYLKSDGFFYFDDVNRKGEQDCLDAWYKMFSIRMGSRHKFGKGQIYFVDSPKSK